MREVTMKKSDLLARVEENREGHREVYEKAMDGYTKAAVAFFQEQLERAKDGNTFVTYFGEPMPEDHTDDYDNVLDMLDMEVGDQITLSNAEFRQYVRDDWGWKQTFIATSSNYIA
jgi:hypothetical protein